MATGTDTLLIPDCPAKPEVYPYTTRYICGSGSILFKDLSWGGTSNSRLWTFPGGDASNLTDSTISVTYDSAGVFDVGLGNANGMASKTFLQRVVVFPAGPSTQSLPANFDFEGSNPLEGWTVINSNSGNTWSFFLTAGFESNQSISIRNGLNKPGQLHELISPSLNLTAHNSINLKFKLYFRNKNAFNRDKLVVSFSRDCGANWTTVFTKTANNSTRPLNTLTTFSAGNAVPFFDTDWREESIIVPSNFRVNNFRVRFSFTTSGGNNLYLDNFSMTGNLITSIENQLNAGEIQIFPNPANSFVLVRLGAGKLEEIRIHDVLGKEFTSNSEPIQDSSEYKIGLTDLPKGLYFLNLKVNGAWIKKKLARN
jgi:hypothetical protein